MLKHRLNRILSILSSIVLRSDPNFRKPLNLNLIPHTECQDILETWEKLMLQVGFQPASQSFIG